METNGTDLFRALWYVARGEAEIRSSRMRAPPDGHASVRALFSGISRGTERLVMSGSLPPACWEPMRAPMQEGTFPFPVKYGYSMVGIVERATGTLGEGDIVFCLQPHQDRFHAPTASLFPVPPDVPPRRATLAANMETALNAHWDAATGPCDHVVVVGAGVVGLLVAHLAARLPGSVVTVVDVDPSRRTLAELLGARFAAPDGIAAGADVVFHTSATGSGLQRAIECAGPEGRVVELSFYGGRAVQVPLGGAFHFRRIELRSSQVSQVSLSRRSRWTRTRRLGAALDLLRDPVLDALVADEIRFTETPGAMSAILGEVATGLPPVIRYE